MNFRRTNFRKAYLTALVLAMGVTPAATALTHAPTVMAAQENQDNSGTAEISVTGVESGATVNAYQIIGGNYTSDGKLKSYHFNHVSDKDGLEIASFEEAKTKGTTVAPTEEEITNIAKAIRKAVQNNTAPTEADATSMTEDTTAPGTYKATVHPGMYLVLVTNAKNHTYNPAIVSVNVTDTNTKTATGSSQDLTKEFKVNNTTAYIKSEEVGGDDNETNTPDPSKPDQTDEKGNDSKKRTNFDMKITNSTDNNSYGDVVNAGRTVNYEITANIPSYSKMVDAPKFTVTDTLASTLTRTETTAVKVGGKAVDSTNYTLTENDHEITLDFKPEYLSGLRAKASADRKLVVTYSAKLADGNNANVNTHDNESSAKLEYTSDMDGNTKTLYANNHVYTFSLDTDSKHIFNKVDENKNALAGATFGIYQDLDGANNKTESKLVTTIDGTGATTKGETVTTDAATTDTSGNLKFTGLDDQTDYYVKEIAAPSGYTLTDAVYRVTVNPTLDANGLLTAYNVEVTPLTVTNGIAADNTGETVTYKYDASGKLLDTTAATDILNTKLLSLPTTGARGALLVTLFSSIGLGAVLVYKKKKSDRKENEE